MFKAVTPIVALLIAIGLAITYVQPSFVAIQATERETTEYENALKHANVLQARIDEKLEQRRGFDQVGLVRLSQLLPTEINEVDIIMTLDGLARDHGMSFGNITVTESLVDETTAVTPNDNIAEEIALGPDAVADPSFAPEATGVTYVEFGFSVEGTYDQLKDFTADLEQSLTLFEIMSLEFKESEGDMTSFEFVIRTYAHIATQ